MTLNLSHSVLAVRDCADVFARMHGIFNGEAQAVTGAMVELSSTLVAVTDSRSPRWQDETNVRMWT